VSLKILAQAMNAAKTTDTDKLIAYLETEAQFDVLKSRKAYFRSWDHQMMQEAYPFTVKAKGQAKDKYDFLKFGDAVPGPAQPLELLAPQGRQRLQDVRPPCKSSFLLEQLVNGLVLGGYYLLLALGLSLIFSVGGIVNLAHGAFYAARRLPVAGDRQALRAGAPACCCRRWRSACSACCSNASCCAASTRPTPS
jgi:hypothetical protein